MRILVVGAGITGTLLAWKLYQQKIPFELWTDPQTPSASAIAAGLINPITGKRLAKIQNFEPLLRSALQTYQQIEQSFHVSLIIPFTILRLIDNEDLLHTFHKKIKLTGFQNHLALKDPFSVENFHFHGKAIEIQPAYRVRLSTLLETLHQHFQKIGCLFYQKFDIQSFTKYPKFDKIFLCRGHQEAYEDLFPGLEWRNAIGEILIFRSPALKLTYILQYQKLSLIPLGGDDYWLGATYLREMDFQNYEPTQDLERFLKQNLNVPYEILQKLKGIRPILRNRQPIVAQSPKAPECWMVNGMGSKGTLLAPYLIEKEVLPKLFA